MTRHESHQSRPTTPTDQSVEADLLRAALGGELTRRQVLRRGRRAGLGLGSLAALTAIALTPGATRACKTGGTSIPPNCIFVCCDGTCDSWKMCLTCVTWPKAAAATAQITEDR